MATFIFANNIDTTLAGGISSASTSLTLSSTQNLPSSIPAGTYLVLTLNDQATRTIYEIVYVTAISGATLTVLRGQEGTAAKAWLTGDYAFSGPTAGQMASFMQGTSTGVTPGTYGNSTTVPQITVNAQGLVSGVTNVPIAFPITSFNGRAGAIVLNSGDVTTALGFNPVNKAGDTMTGNLAIQGNTPTFTMMSPAGLTSGGKAYRFLANISDANDFGFILQRWNGTSFDPIISTDVNRNVALAASATVAGAVTVTGAVTSNNLQTNSTSNSALYIANGGNLRIGSSGGASRYFRVNASTGAIEIIDTNYVNVVAWISNDGTWNSLAGANFFATSDENRKTNIDRQAQPRPIHRVAPWSTFTWRESGEWGASSIAQDVLKIAPEYVKQEDDINGRSFLMVNHLGETAEVAHWAAQGVDRLEARIDVIEQLLAERS
jgi:hypothetical protein